MMNSAEEEWKTPDEGWMKRSSSTPNARYGTPRVDATLAYESELDLSTRSLRTATWSMNAEVMSCRSTLSCEGGVSG